MKMDSKLILVINPGSTSTKVAIFDGHKNLFQKSIIHPQEELKQFKYIADQYSYRKNIILEVIGSQSLGVSFDDIQVVVGRGGLIKPVPSGVIEVNDALIRDLKHSPLGEHASNLGGLIADDIAKHLPNAKAYIVDPVVVDEMNEIARIAGHPLFQRKSILHALNQKAVARHYARNNGVLYEDLKLVVAHLGGGISVGVHIRGKIIDVNQGLDGEGPFSPERSGTLPSGDLVRLCFSGKYTQEEVIKMILGKGGMVAYLGTNDVVEVEKRIAEGDEYAKLIFEAMAYQVAKQIAQMAVVCECELDAILITGGVAYSKAFIELISRKVQRIAPVFVYPGEDEMYALAMNGMMILDGEAKFIEYN
jgi:butyrate kinase